MNKIIKKNNIISIKLFKKQMDPYPKHISLEIRNFI